MHQRILDTAEDIVRSRGYNGFSYADIASILDVSKAALHHHFPTKVDLGMALIDRFTNAVLDYLNRGFANHVVRENGQDFIFSPRPERPPVLVGGFPPHAIERAIKYGEGWFAINLSPEELEPHIRNYRDAAATAGRPAEVTTYVRFDEHETDLVGKIRTLADVGVDRVIGSTRYTDQDTFDRTHGLLAEASVQL